MISVRGRGRPYQECPSVTLSVALFVAPLCSSLPPKLEISKQPDGTLRPKSPATTSVPKYSEDDLQRILKAVLEAQSPAPAPAISEIPQEKLKARSPDVYCRKSHIDC